MFGVKRSTNPMPKAKDKEEADDKENRNSTAGPTDDEKDECSSGERDFTDFSHVRSSGYGRRSQSDSSDEPQRAAQKTRATFEQMNRAAPKKSYAHVKSSGYGRTSELPSKEKGTDKPCENETY